VERTKSWQVAEVRGDATPYGLPHVLRRARWDPDAGRDAVGLDVVAPLGAAPAGLVSEATGVLKQGQHSAGVARP
jgi:SRSO17 transposase